MKHTGWQIIYWLDLTLNVLLGGWAGEYLSSRCYRKKDDARRYYIGYRIINAVFFLQTDHCRESFVSQRSQLHMPWEYRNATY